MVSQMLSAQGKQVVATASAKASRAVKVRQMMTFFAHCPPAAAPGRPHLIHMPPLPSRSPPPAPPWPAAA
jgi:hypothetical protein